jgi:hypothetical protein
MRTLPGSLADKRDALLRLRLQRLRAERGPDRTPIAALDSGWTPASPAQQQLWFLQHCAPGLPVYLSAFPTRLRGELDVEALRRALSGVLERHEVLRSTYHLTADGLMQRVEPPGRLDLTPIDLTSLPPDLAWLELRRCADADARRPFDLAAGPMLRLALYRLAERDHVLLVTMHHICWDGWSTGVITAELGKLYRAFRDGTPADLDPPAIQYGDYARWQAGWLAAGKGAADAAYWRERLAGLAPLDLPSDRPRPPVQSFRGTAG